MKERKNKQFFRRNNFKEEDAMSILLTHQNKLLEELVREVKPLRGNTSSNRKGPQLMNIVNKMEDGLELLQWPLEIEEKLDQLEESMKNIRFHKKPKHKTNSVNSNINPSYYHNPSYDNNKSIINHSIKQSGIRLSSQANAQKPIMPDPSVLTSVMNPLRYIPWDYSEKTNLKKDNVVINNFDYTTPMYNPDYFNPLNNPYNGNDVNIDLNYMSPKTQALSSKKDSAIKSPITKDKSRLSKAGINIIMSQSQTIRNSSDEIELTESEGRVSSDKKSKV